MYSAKTLIVLSAFLLLACAKEKESGTSNIIEVYNQQDYENKIEIIDTFCIAETKRAKSDINKDRIVLNITDFASERFYYGSIPFREDVITELSKFNIETDTIYKFHSCIGPKSKGIFNSGCYNDIMMNKVAKKYGVNFIDSIKDVLEKKYVLSVPGRIFEFHSCDRPAYNDLETDDAAYDFCKKKGFEIEADIVYPKGYKASRAGNNSHTNSHFILMKNGTIKSLEFELYFADPENKRFESYFKKHFTELISNVKWIHPTYAGLITNSEMYFSFDFK